MNTKKFFAGLAAVATLLAIGAMAPRAAKAVYSSPVTVVNTNTQPVEGVDVEKLARTPYQSNAVSSGCGGSTCLYTFSAAPAGYRLVGEHLSGKLLASGGVTGPVVGEIDDNSLQADVFFQAPLGEMQGTFSQATVSQPLKMYVDSSRGAPFVVVASRWNIGFFVLTGYLENCSVTGCPAVQH